MSKSAQSIKQNINVANIISFLRLLLIFPFVYAMNEEKYIRAGLILVLSAFTDFMDGFVARKFNQKTRFGKMLDPAADKLTLIAVMICIGIKFSDVLPFIAILILKEICMMGASLFLLKNQKFPTEAKWYGKVGTAAFYTSVTIIVSLKALWNIENIPLNITLMTITALLMLYALVKYFRIFVNMIK